MSHGVDKTNQPGLAFFSPKIGQIAKLLQSQYDFVFFDTSPSLLFPDAPMGTDIRTALSSWFALTTTRKTPPLSASGSWKAGSPYFGTILNDWTPEVGHDYGYYSYKSYVGGGASGNGARAEA